MQFKKTSDPPVGKGGLPLIGHTYVLVNSSPVGLWKTIKTITAECADKGGVATWYLGPRRLYGDCVWCYKYDPERATFFIQRRRCSGQPVITDPEDCLTVSNACLNKDYFYSFAENFVGTSIFTAKVSSWKTNRKLLNPAFHHKVLSSFIGIFNVKAKELADKLVVGRPFDIGEQLRLCSLETICVTTLGSDFGEKNSRLQKEYLDWQKEILEILIERFMKFWFHLDCIYRFSTLKTKEDIVVNKLHAFSNSIISQKKAEIKSSQSPGKREDVTDNMKPFMDLILELAEETKCFTDDEVRGETDTIISGGHDTSGTTLTYALILIGTYPDVQEKVYQEILQVVGRTDRNLNQDDLVKLVYIDAVLKETLRLYPIAPILGRSIEKDVKLRNYTLRQNSSCILSIYGMHRHPIWGNDGDCFKPERWLRPDTVPRAGYFGGFSVGKRSCIGRGYAMMFMKVVLVHVLRRYRVEADVSNLKLKLDVTLKPESGHHATLEERCQ